MAKSVLDGSENLLNVHLTKRCCCNKTLSVFQTPLCNRRCGIDILTAFSEKTSPGRQMFHQLPLSVRSLFAFFTHIQMIHAGYVKVTPGKPQTGLVKLNFHQVPGRLNFYWVKGKIHWVGSN